MNGCDDADWAVSSDRQNGSSEISALRKDVGDLRWEITGHGLAQVPRDIQNCDWS